MSATRLAVAAAAVAWVALGLAFLLGAYGPALGAAGILAALASTRRHLTAPRPDVTRTLRGEPRQGAVVHATYEARAPTSGLVALETEAPLGFLLLSQRHRSERGHGVLEQDLQAVAVGEVAWPPVRMEVTDGWGLHAERIAADVPTPYVVVPDAKWALHGRRLGQRHPVKATIKALLASERSLEIETVRPYGPGDALRDIDWKVTSRMGDLHVRQREKHVPRPVTVILDCSPGMRVQRQDSKLLSAARVAYGALAAASGAGTTSRLVRLDENGCDSRHVFGINDAEAMLAQTLNAAKPLTPAEAAPTTATAAQVARVVADAPGLQVLVIDGELQPELAKDLMALLRQRGPLVVLVPATGAHLYRRFEARGEVLAALRRWRKARDELRTAAGRLQVPFLVLRPGSEAEALAHIGRMLA